MVSMCFYEATQEIKSIPGRMIVKALKIASSRRRLRARRLSLVGVFISGLDPELPDRK
jgi:hypothetical protein